MSNSPTSPAPATLPPFMPPPFMDPSITDEQHTPAKFPPYVPAEMIPIYDPSLSHPIPNPTTLGVARNRNLDQTLGSTSADAFNANGKRTLDSEGSGLGNGVSNGSHQGGTMMNVDLALNMPATPVKRAMRACSNCRKDKTKCDGGRPCSNCTKKGFKDSECVDGCVHCRRERLRCLGGTPCSSCESRNIECIPDVETERRSGPALNRSVNVLDFSHAVPQPANYTSVQTTGPPPQVVYGNTNPPPGPGIPPSPNGFTMLEQPDGSMIQVPIFLNPTQHTIQFLPAPPRNRTNPADRAKTACFACRRDNKKCSNSTPCSRCQQRGENCVEVPKTSPQKRLKLRCKNCRRDNKKCEESRPCKHCADLQEVCEDIPRKGRGGGSRVKVACMGCRKDKIQCENERPCKGCIRKGIRCIERVCPVCEGAGDCNSCRYRKGREEEGEHDEENEEDRDHDDMNGHQNHGEPQFALQTVKDVGMNDHPLIFPPLDASDVSQISSQMMGMIAQSVQSHHQQQQGHEHQHHLQQQQQHHAQMFFNTTPNPSAPPSPRRNVSSVRFDGEQTKVG